MSIELVLDIHFVLSILLVSNIMFLLFSSKIVLNNTLFYKLTRNFTPITHLLNAANIYVGLVLIYMFNRFSLLVALMIIVSIMVIIMEAKRHKIFKRNLDNFEIIRYHAYHFYLFEVGMLLVLGAIVEVFS